MDVGIFKIVLGSLFFMNFCCFHKHAKEPRLKKMKVHGIVLE